jgi:hypothetical protein
MRVIYTSKGMSKKFGVHVIKKYGNTSALPTSLSGSQTWAMKEQDKYRMSEKMIFMGRMAKYT